MKTKLLSLAGALLCAAALSSCVTYDEYGYGYGAAPVGGSVYVDDYPDYGYGYGGYGYGYAPAYTGISFFGLGGYPYGRYYGRDYHHHHDDHHHHHYSSRSSANQRYISRVARARPDTSSRVTAPRTPASSRPSIGAIPRSRGSSSPRSFTAPSRSVPSVRSMPRAESRPSPSMRPSRGTTASFRPSAPAPRASAPVSRPSGGGGGGRSIESRRSR